VIVAHVGGTSVPCLGAARSSTPSSWPGPMSRSRPGRRCLAPGFTDFPFASVRPMLTTSVPLERRSYPVLLPLVRVLVLADGNVEVLGT
jgi:hypothetical protein